MNYTILQGDNRTTLKTLADDSIDAIVTDPPYGIDFLGKSWDANTGALETYQECLRVLKPGGHILAFSAARTYHHLAVTLEQAGFEIRDQIMWIYSSGFPKSQDVGRSIERTNNKAEGKKNKIAKVIDTTKNAGFGQTDHAHVRAGEEWSTTEKQVGQVEITRPEAQQWSGWGTALKPAHEPIALARKPIKLSIAKNCQKYGVGALNIDATRVEFVDDKAKEQHIKERIRTSTREHNTVNQKTSVFGSFAAKLDQDYDNEPKKDTADLENLKGRFPSNVLGEIPDYQKYFYCPKVSRRERHIGHETPPAMFGDVASAYGPDGQQFAVGLDACEGVITSDEMVKEMGGYFVDTNGNETTGNGNMYWVPHLGVVYGHGLKTEYENWHKANGTVSTGNTGNNHPTVKPIALMKYLIKLITPPGGTVLDPFNGSGSTGCAAVELGHTYIGCELDPKYVEIAKKRIQAWYATTRDPAADIFDDH